MEIDDYDALTEGLSQVDKAYGKALATDTSKEWREYLWKCRCRLEDIRARLDPPIDSPTRE